MFFIDKRILNFLVIITLTFVTFAWTFFIFHQPFCFQVVLGVIAIRMVASFLILKDYSLSWSKATQRTFIIKSIVYIVAFLVYLPIFYGKVRFALLVSELFLYLFAINFLMYSYHYIINRSRTLKTKSVVIYGAGKAGIKLEEEFRNSEYKVTYFVDDDKILHKRSIDGVKIFFKDELRDVISKIGCDDKLSKLKEIVPEFNHQVN